MWKHTRGGALVASWHTFRTPVAYVYSLRLQMNDSLMNTQSEWNFSLAPSGGTIRWSSLYSTDLSTIKCYLALCLITYEVKVKRIYKILHFWTLEILIRCNWFQRLKDFSSWPLLSLSLLLPQSIFRECRWKPWSLYIALGN